VLKDEQAVQQAIVMKRYHDGERAALDSIRRYWRGRQKPPYVIPSAAPREVRQMASMARVNVIGIIIDSLAQSLFVDGFRGRDDGQNNDVWKAWQANKLDARQTGIHRAALAYRAAYAVVLPGDKGPVIRGRSPRQLCALYGEDPDWPIFGFDRLGNGLWKLLDEDGIYYLSEKQGNAGTRSPEFEFIESRQHGAGVTPVVRYLDEEDLDADDEPEPEHGRPQGDEIPTGGQVAPYMPLQDQVDLTTFGLLVAQHYSAFRQRWILGWVAESEVNLVEKVLEQMELEGEEPTASERADAEAAAATRARLSAAASTLWTFDVDPNEAKIGEFSETSLKGYLDSRESTLKYAATISQTPVHELIGELVNLSAEALAAAEAGKDRKVDERKTNFGESHEQTFWLAGRFASPSIEVPDEAQVVWRDTSARAFAATVDALGKLVTMLGIPPQELWERVPGATQQDVNRWKAAAAQGNSFQVLADMLERQANGGGDGGPAFQS
jgi:hypothetical protein